MKKIIVILSVCLFLFNGCVFEDSISGQNNIDLDAILEIKSEQLSTEIELNHKNVIDIKAQIFIADNAQKETQLAVDNTKCELTYMDSIHYPLRSETVHRYIVDNNEENTIILKENGDVVAILYSYTKLSIEQTATPAEILEPLKAELSKIVDIAHYQNVQIPTPSDNKYWKYDYYFYNECNGYLTDTLVVSVKYDGSVIGLKIYNLAIKDFEVNINKEKEHSAIELKLKNLYNTDLTQYLSHKIVNDPCVVQYNDQLYILYDIVVTYNHTQVGEVNSFIIQILIPLNAISN